MLGSKLLEFCLRGIANTLREFCIVYDNKKLFLGAILRCGAITPPNFRHHISSLLVELLPLGASDITDGLRESRVVHDDEKIGPQQVQFVFANLFR